MQLPCNCSTMHICDRSIEYILNLRLGIFASGVLTLKSLWELAVKVNLTPTSIYVTRDQTFAFNEGISLK